MKYMLCFLVLLSLIGCASPMEVKQGITTPELSSLGEGTYRGKAFIFPVRVVLETDLIDGRITDIRILRHFNGQGTPGEAVADAVVKHQSLEVDVIAGATHSSVTILKALDDALSGGSHD